MFLPKSIWWVVVGICAIVAVATGDPGAVGLVVGSVALTFIIRVVCRVTGRDL